MSQRKELIEALVGEKHAHLYLSNAEFKHRIEAIAEMIPSWIDALAVNAARDQAELEQRTRALAGYTGFGYDESNRGEENYGL